MQTSESSLVRDRCSTTESPNQLVLSLRHHIVAVCSPVVRQATVLLCSRWHAAAAAAAGTEDGVDDDDIMRACSRV